MMVSMRGWGPVPKPFSTPASPQHQSPLFATLPVEIRRHIYMQLWLDCGLTQHILVLAPKSYLQSFPCVLSREELDREPGPPPRPPPPPADVADDSDPNDEDGEADQSQPYDDPGDINGALQDLSAGDATQPPDTPWCVHLACFRRWSRKWDHSFSSMYTACYRRDHRGWRDLAGSPVLTAFLVCRRVHAEASESLFSSVRFSFTSLTAMRVFVSQVPRSLVARVRFADIVAADLGFLSDMAGGTVDDRTPAQQVYETLRESFPSLRELRVTLHPSRLGEVIPGPHALEPLHALAHEMGSSLRRFEVFLPARCDGVGSSSSELCYGEAPPSLRGAPFTVRLVPPGWHEADDCEPFECPVGSLQG
ncbi:hypothetical protein INS49_009149 [Diaporthe citri]|uniref:uncharacterized protein n=1 Tax=Diaporthe citri TaxID=83186 RepID=UPI001C81D8EB|nr:uncharacterized protein INS49_009149 [Diaporthe citri]KAG6364046.1 hypothetical protein INS49_009149 [Diaporthe citri]